MCHDFQPDRQQVRSDFSRNLFGYGDRQSSISSKSG